MSKSSFRTLPTPTLNHVFLGKNKIENEQEKNRSVAFFLSDFCKEFYINAALTCLRSSTKTWWRKPSMKLSGSVTRGGVTGNCGETVPTLAFAPRSTEPAKQRPMLRVRSPPVPPSKCVSCFETRWVKGALCATNFSNFVARRQPACSLSFFHFLFFPLLFFLFLFFFSFLLFTPPLFF